jgi:hypothetical protein
MVSPDSPGVERAGERAERPQRGGSLSGDVRVPGTLLGARQVGGDRHPARLARRAAGRTTGGPGIGKGLEDLCAEGGASARACLHQRGVAAWGG